MRDSARISIVLAALSEYWEAHPDFRLGQIIDNATAAYCIDAMKGPGPDVFYVEDAELIHGLDLLTRLESA